MGGFSSRGRLRDSVFNFGGGLFVLKRFVLDFLSKSFRDEWISFGLGRGSCGCPREEGLFILNGLVFGVYINTIVCNLSFFIYFKGWTINRPYWPSSPFLHRSVLLTIVIHVF